MNLKTIDTVFLHYPFESMESLQQKEIKQRLTKAFEFFEEMVLQHKIRKYGILMNINSVRSFI